MDKKARYYVNSENEFIIENYNQIGPFSNFLPGIAGLFGIPMWVFYVNRGQAICSFGVRSKDSPIMEFLPANRAYQLATLQGFRTFIKVNPVRKIQRPKLAAFSNGVYEPFQPHSSYHFPSVTQKMHITSHELKIQESNPEMGLEIEVEYFTVPNEPFASIARLVTICNISKKDLSVEILDGTPLIIPYGVSNFFLQKMRRTIEAWMIVENTEHLAPFYRLKVDPKDVSEVKLIREGNFYLTLYIEQGKAPTLLPIIVDPEVIFGEINDFSYPVNYARRSGFIAPKAQINQGRLPSAMAHVKSIIIKNTSIKLYSLIGHMQSKEKLNSMTQHISPEPFFEIKKQENKDIIEKLKGSIYTMSGNKKFDLYCGQTFLDNVLRGGFPITYANHHKHVFYAYSRKHGDLERDYNKFLIDPTYFSQGEGNYRDINQNRRNDVFFNPDVADSNILFFYNLIQADGFNPLILKGIRFRAKGLDFLKDGFKDMLDTASIEKIRQILSDSFAPGELFMRMENAGIKLKMPAADFLQIVLRYSASIWEAEHGEGYWIDHWTYNLDLVEGFLSVYPEKLKDVLLDKKESTFYDNIFCVKPRSDRCLLNAEHMVRQYHSLERDTKKDNIIKKRDIDPHKMRTKNGEGEVYKTTLLVKMLCIVANKISSLDPFGIGIEMEADKPGWCDSMNGLPGLFGSSVPEVFELKRQILFILDSMHSLKLEGDFRVILPEELHDFLKNMESLFRDHAEGDDFYIWDRSNLFKEDYRERVKLGFNGAERPLTYSALREMLNIFLLKVNSAIKKAYIPSKKLHATYFINEVTRYEFLNKMDHVKNAPLVRPVEFKNITLPLFLESAVKAMKSEVDRKKARLLHAALKNTGLYDKKLKMFKINEPLGDITKEIGRSSVFTPGWLENESVWLHMEYKYLLEVLKAGLYEEFFEEFKNVLVPFQRPNVYGRSIFENSSFIVSSSFPDKRMHGRGFVARLSGSSAEMINIWLLMSVGKTPFFMDKNAGLNLRFNPALPKWLFTKKPQNGFPKNIYAFKFLNEVTVVYHNPKMRNTAGRNAVCIKSMTIEYNDGKKIDIEKDVIPPPHARDIRDRNAKRIDIYLS